MSVSAPENEAPSQHIVLDGGMGQALLARSQTKPTALWSAKFLLEEPELVRQLHYDFIAAGADVITLNSYTVTPLRITGAGLSHKNFQEMQKAAIDIALSARKTFLEDHANQPIRPIKIAGCLPPLKASYVAEAAPDLVTCTKAYEQIVAEQDAFVDLYLIETMSNLREARAALKAALSTSKPVWLSFVPTEMAGPNQNPSIKSGEPFTDIAKLIQNDLPHGLLLNCATPETITYALPHLISACEPWKKKLLFGAYANGFVSTDPLKPGKTTDVLQRRQNPGPEDYADFAKNWINSGCSIVGGCCEIGPEYISVLSQKLRG